MKKKQKSIKIKYRGNEIWPREISTYILRENNLSMGTILMENILPLLKMTQFLYKF